ncbi:MAG: ABC transporter substrate-binding protein [archaeon]|nr:ABC transporter substrate-binding protein [archaeon]
MDNEKLVGIAILSLVLVLLAGCASSEADSPAANQKAVVGITLTPTSTLLHIADEKGFFEKNGVDVELKEFSAGKLSFQAMLAGSVDFAALGDLPAMLAKAQGNDFYVLTEVGTNHNEAPMIIRDDDSPSMTDYFKTKRKISTALGGGPEFALYLFMKEYNISKENIEIIGQKPEDAPGAFANGSVDGIVFIEPYVTFAESTAEFDSKIVKLPYGAYPTKYIMAGNKEFVDRNPETAKRIIRALVEAEKFVKENPEETKEIVARRTKFDPQIIEKVWADFEYNTGITPQLLQNWQDELKWAIETGKAEESAANTDFESALRADLFTAAGN